jgi:DNA-binding IclR family transcriptional regulator
VRVERDTDGVLQRAALIMDAFCDEAPMQRLSSLVQSTGLPRSTVHRLAEQLVAVGWLERLSHGYRVGTRLFEVGSHAGRYERLLARAGPWLQDLLRTTNRSTHLAVLDGAEVVYLVKLSVRDATVPTRMGGRQPVHSTALGKALLAFGSEAQLQAVLDRGLRRYTPQTIVDEGALHAALAEVRKAEVAFDHEETLPGLFCVAAPVRGAGNAIAAVSVSGPREGFDAKVLSRSVSAAAQGIWNDVFGPGHTKAAGAKVGDVAPRAAAGDAATPAPSPPPARAASRARPRSG